MQKWSDFVFLNAYIFHACAKWCKFNTRGARLHEGGMHVQGLKFNWIPKLCSRERPVQEWTLASAPCMADNYICNNGEREERFMACVAGRSACFKILGKCNKLYLIVLFTIMFYLFNGWEAGGFLL